MPGRKPLHIMAVWTHLMIRRIDRKKRRIDMFGYRLNEGLMNPYFFFMILNLARIMRPSVKVE